MSPTMTEPDTVVIPDDVSSLTETLIVTSEKEETDPKKRYCHIRCKVCKKVYCDVKISNTITRLCGSYQRGMKMCPSCGGEVCKRCVSQQHWARSFYRMFKTSKNQCSECLR